MRLNCGPTRAAELVPTPDSTPARWPRRAVVLAAMALAVVFGLAATPAMADDLVPQPVLVLNDCSATLSLIDLTPGNSYKIQVTDAAGTTIYEHSFVASEAVLDSFFEVPVGTHELRVSDAADSKFTAMRDVVVGPCATDAAAPAAGTDAPAITVTPNECDLLGATDVTVVASGLESGTYPVGVVVAGEPVEGVADASLTAEKSTVVFPDVPNGANYLVWLKDPAGAVVASSAVELPVCDLPTLDEPVGESATATGYSDGTLASTGIPVAGIVVVAIGALQVGALVGGTALLRGRGRGEHRAAL